MKRILVYGHVTTWIIEEIDERYTVKSYNRRIPVMVYNCLSEAHRAIRIAEMRYLECYPDCPVANTHLWFNHGVPIIDNLVGNYFD